MNKQNRNRPIDTENKLMVARGERGEGGGWVEKKKKNIKAPQKQIEYFGILIWAHVLQKERGVELLWKTVHVEVP